MGGHGGSPFQVAAVTEHQGDEDTDSPNRDRVFGFNQRAAAKVSRGSTPSTQPPQSQRDGPQGQRQSTLAEALQQQQQRQQQAQPPLLNLKPLKVKTSRGAAAAAGTKGQQPAAAPLQLAQRTKSAQLPVPPPGSGGDDSARGGALPHRSQSSPSKASPTLEIPVAARLLQTSSSGRLEDDIIAAAVEVSQRALAQQQLHKARSPASPLPTGSVPGMPGTVSPLPTRAHSSSPGSPLPHQPALPQQPAQQARWAAPQMQRATSDTLALFEARAAATTAEAQALCLGEALSREREEVERLRRELQRTTLERDELSRKAAAWERPQPHGSKVVSNSGGHSAAVAAPPLRRSVSFSSLNDPRRVSLGEVFDLDRCSIEERAAAEAAHPDGRRPSFSFLWNQLPHRQPSALGAAALLRDGGAGSGGGSGGGVARTVASRLQSFQLGGQAQQAGQAQQHGFGCWSEPPLGSALGRVPEGSQEGEFQVPVWNAMGGSAMGQGMTYAAVEVPLGELQPLGLVGIEQQGRVEDELQRLFNKKMQCVLRKVEITACGQAEQTAQATAAAHRTIAERDFDLTKSKVELLRWRQSSALSHIQLSSSEEDVKRYQRVSVLLQRQSQLEREAKLILQQTALADSAAATERGRQQAAARLSELESAQAGLKELQQRLGDLEQQLLASMQRGSELGRQLKAAKDEVAGKTAAAAEVQAKLKETTAAAEDRAALLQQEASQWRADYAELEKRHRTAEDVAAQRRATADELQRHADLLQQEVAVKADEVAALEGRLDDERRAAADLRIQLEEKKARIALLEEQAAARAVGAFVNELESPGLPEFRLPAAPAALAGKVKEHSIGEKVAANSQGMSQEPVQPAQKAAQAGKEKGANGPARGKSGSDPVSEVAAAAAAAAAGKAGKDTTYKENASGLEGRARRDRTKAHPFWMGPQLPGAKGEILNAEQMPAAKVEAAKAEQLPAARGKKAGATKKPSAAAKGAAGAKQHDAQVIKGDAGAEQQRSVEAHKHADAEPVENAAVPLQPAPEGESPRAWERPQDAAVAKPFGEGVAEEQPASSGRTRKRGRRKAEPQERKEGIQDKKAKTQAEELAGNKNRSRKQLKRPQGEIKTDLTSVWGGATPVLAAADGEVKQGPQADKPARKSNLGPKSRAAPPQPEQAVAAVATVAPPAAAPEAAGSSQTQQEAAAAAAVAKGLQQAAVQPRGSQGSVATSKPAIPSRIQENPLGPLNQRTLAAAANMLQRPVGPFKTSLQKAIAARGEASQGQQPQKRKLLPVTTYGTAGHVAPTESLFGSFKVPRLMKGGS
ncbi:hypothetical protein N2152v2_009853 [Parachlorella kessleri]